MKIFFLIVGCLLLSSCNTSKEEQLVSFPVEVAPVIQKDVPIYLETIGNALAPITVQIRSQVSAKLKKAYVEEGDYVHMGQLLFGMNFSSFQAAYEKAKATLEKDKANLEIAQKKVERNKQLVEKQYVSTLAYEQLQAEAKAAEAQVGIDTAELEAARINLEHCFIFAPIDGKIGFFLVNIGNLVSPSDSTPITELKQIMPIDIQFSFPQKDFDQVQEHASERLRFEVIMPITKEILKGGVVDFIDNKINQNTGTFFLKGFMPNKEGKLWPGAFVRVRLLLKTDPNAILIPTAALQYGQQGAFVYTLKQDDTVMLNKILVGEEIENQTVVKEGLNSDDIVVTNGQINLRPGIKVRVINPGKNNP